MAATVKLRVCKDCAEEGNGAKRPAPHPGPRCATHHRLARKRVKLRAAECRVKNTYELTPIEYDALYFSQGNRCFVCRQSTGKVRRLSVDHDHDLCVDHPPERGCRRCVRALLCRRCNTLVAWWGVEALHRAIEVLIDPPARKVLARLALDS